MKHNQLVATACWLLAVGACSKDETGSLPPSTEVPAEVGAALGTVQFEAWQLNQDVISLIQDVSADFTLDLTQQPASVKVSIADSRLSGVIGNLYQYIREAHRLAVKADQQGQSTAALRQPLGPTGLPPGVGARSQKLIGVATVALIAGLGLFGYGMLSGIGDAVDKRSQPVRAYIEQATPEELALTAGVLGLPSGSAQQAVLDHFNGLGPGQRNVKRGLIEDEIAARQQESGIRSLEASEVMQSIADSSVALGKEAVKLTVGGLTTAAGGQGMAQAMEAAGASPALAAVGDLALSATSNQPLDWVTREVDVALTSAERQEVTIPEPEQSMTPEAAHRALAASDDLSDDFDALLTLLRDINLRSAGAAAPEADGSIRVQVPKRVHFSDVGNAFDDGALTMEIPQMGKAQVMVAPEGKPALITSVDTHGGAELVYGKPPASAGTDGGSVTPADGGVVPVDGGSSDYPAICRQAVICARAALDAQGAAQFEATLGEGGLCFQSSVGVDVCTQNCRDAVTSWSEDGYC